MVNDIKHTETVPWYRRPEYDGNLSEAEKYELDSFRMREKHPATASDNLPEEVQCYINRIELELYDEKQDFLVAKSLALSGLGAALICLSYFGYGAANSGWSYLFPALLLIFPWIEYRKKWNKNVNELSPRDMNSPYSTDEQIKMEWELNYIAHNKTNQISDI